MQKHGINFFSMNNFKAVLEVLFEHRSRGILKDLSSDTDSESQSLSSPHECNCLLLFWQIDHGGDFIITQICYTVEPLIKYINHARSEGIMAPFMVGIVVPESFQQYKLMEKISKVRMPHEMIAEVEKFKSDNEKVKNYFVQLALNLIEQILDANVGMHGVQFYTMNTFGPTLEVLAELRKRGIIKEPSTGDVRSDAKSQSLHY